MKFITRLEEAILIAILRLEDNVYGVTINKHVSESSQKNYSMGALYFALDQLLRKGYVKKTVKRFYHEKGGRSRTKTNAPTEKTEREFFQGQFLHLP